MSRSLVSLSVINSIFQDTGTASDDLFIPFVVNLAAELELNNFEPENVNLLCDKFEKTYGLRVPYKVMLYVLNRAKQRNILNLNEQKNAYYITPNALDKYNFSEKMKDHSDKWNTTIEIFQAFCEKQNSPLTTAQAEAIFLGYLRANDTEIFMAQGCSIIPSLTADTNTYLANAFINDLVETDNKETLDFILEFALGHILASTIMNWRNMGRYVGHLQQLKIYLDAPIILQLLGLDHSALTEAAKEFVSLMQERGAIVRVFEDTLSEVVDLLEGAKPWIENPLYNQDRATKATTFIIENRWSTSDIEVLIANSRTLLSELDINVTPAPSHIQLKEFCIDEAALEKCIVHQYKEKDVYFDYQNAKRSILRDISYISSIIRLRKGRISFRLSETPFIFVTYNSGLIRAVRKYEFEECGAGERDISSCISDTMLATFAWFEAPARGKTVGVKRVIAQAIAAVQPTPSLMSALYSELKKRKANNEIDEIEYAAIAVDPFIRRELSRKTQNDSEQFTAQTADELVAEYRKRFELEAKRAYEKDEAIINTELMISRATIDSKTKKVNHLESNYENLIQFLSRGVFLFTFIAVVVIGDILTYFSSRLPILNLVLFPIGIVALFPANFLKKKTYNSLRKRIEDEPSM